jgi:Tfp pilus assembly protein PilF
MTEALIGRLSAIHNLRVISHTSVIRFRDPQVSAPEVARILGVDALVEGSVIREGSRIRITAQLIRGATDEHFWSATYDREMRDALTMQSELAESIAEKVEVSVTGDEHRRFTATRPVAPEVYESYLKGLYGQTHGNAEQSAADFEDAIHKDATFAPAYLGLAEVWTGLGSVAGGVSPAEARPKVIGFARQALALDPDLVAAHVILANVLQEEWHWAEAETEYRRALDLNPNDPLARSGFALWLLCEGRTDEAVAWIQSARKLDPTAVTGHDVSWILFQAHRNDEAIRESRSAVVLQSDDVAALSSLGFELAATDKPAEAIPILQKAIALSHGNFASTGVLIRAYARAGRRRDALALLAQLRARKKTGYAPAAAFVNAYLGLDDREQTFYWLEQAYNEKSNILQYVKTHPYFDPIRSDPRFIDLMRRVGLN